MYYKTIGREESTSFPVVCRVVFKTSLTLVRAEGFNGFSFLKSVNSRKKYTVMLMNLLFGGEGV